VLVDADGDLVHPWITWFIDTAAAADHYRSHAQHATATLRLTA
jgi:hypothetical protein